MDPLEWPRFFSSTPPLSSNSIFNSDNVSLSYNGYNALVFSLPDPPRTCPECGSHMERYDVCPNHRVPHYRELALFQGTEATFITDPARRLVRIPDHYPFYMDLSEFGNGQPDTQPRETPASMAVNPVGHQGQEAYLDDVHPPLNAETENYILGEEEDVPGTANGYTSVRSRLPSISAAVEQSRSLATGTGPSMIPGSSNQRTPVESRED